MAYNRERCKECKRPVEEVGRISARGLCYGCGVRRHDSAARAMRNRRSTTKLTRKRIKEAIRIKFNGHKS